MARKKQQKTYWTPKRLIELRVKARTLSIEQLVSHFGRKQDEILQAIKYEENKRLLFLGIKRETINGKAVKVMLFKPEYAYKGAKEIQLIGANILIF